MPNRSRRILYLCLLLCTIGCATIPKPRTVEFIESEYDPYAGSGTGTIAGQAFFRTRGGDVKFGAGCEVHLNPVTSYSTEWFERYVKNYETLQEPDPSPSFLVIPQCIASFRFGTHPNHHFSLENSTFSHRS